MAIHKPRDFFFEILEPPLSLYVDNCKKKWNYIHSLWKTIPSLLKGSTLFLNGTWNFKTYTSKIVLIFD